MEKLMKPTEYAQTLGISRQAVYAKIKRGILTAKNVEGKLYIVVDNETDAPEKEKVSKVDRPAPVTANHVVSNADNQDYKALLKAKDETIAVLKNTVEDLKESNKQISATLKGEIDLLKEAFYEMRTLYVHQLEQKKSHDAEEAIEIMTDEEPSEEEHWIGVKKFFNQHNITKEKAQQKIMKRLKKAYKSGDERIMKVDNKLKFNVNKSYKDLLG
ncbi:MAG TPA: DUF3972 domain-containing protein [Sulfurovum sp.]